jgi:hypothetical protein
MAVCATKLFHPINERNEIMSDTEKQTSEPFVDFLIRLAVRSFIISAVTAVVGPVVGFIAAVTSGDDVGDII